MPGPIYLHLPGVPDDAVVQRVWIDGVEFTGPFGGPYEMGPRMAATASVLAPTGWTSRVHDGAVPPPRDDGPKWVGKRKKR